MHEKIIKGFTYYYATHRDKEGGHRTFYLGKDREEAELKERLILSKGRGLTRPLKRRISYAFLFVIFALGLLSMSGYMTGFFSYEPSQTAEFDVNDGWNLSEGFLRASMGEYAEDFPLSSIQADNGKIIFDVSQLDLNSTGRLYIDLIVSNTLVDSRYIDILNTVINATVNDTEPVVPPMNETAQEAEPAATNETQPALNETATDQPIAATNETANNKAEKPRLKNIKQAHELRATLKDKRGEAGDITVETEGEKIILRANKERTNVIIRDVQTTTDLEIKTGTSDGKEVVAVEKLDPEQELEIESATLTILKTSDVRAIGYCPDDNFNFETLACSDWQATSIPFTDNGDTITFTVTHFSAYSGLSAVTLNGVNLSKYGAASNQAVNYSGLVGWWKLEKGNGTYWNDSSGNSKAGTQGTAANLPIFTAGGATGGAYKFDGINDYIELGNTVMNVNSGTISLWMNPSSVSGSERRPISDVSGYIYFEWKGATSLKFSGGGGFTPGTTQVNQTNTWYHLVGTWDTTSSNITKLYVNGALIGYLNTTTQAVLNAIRIGYGNGALTFNGSLDEVTIWNRTLSAGEVLNLYNRTKNIYTDHSLGASIANSSEPPSNSTVSYSYDWRLFNKSIALVNMPFDLNGSNPTTGNWTTIADYSSYANHAYYNGSAQAMPRWNRTAGYDGKGAYQFDGTDDFVTASATTSTANMTFNAWLKVNSLSIKNISVGSASTCILLDNGDIYCWGDNTYGQLGDGTRTQRNIPTKSLMTAATKMSIGAASYSVCAVNTSGTYCWGHNQYGQIGNGSSTSSPFAVSFPTKNLMAAATQISVGYQHTCAVNSSGMYCWGLNNNGQFGNGSSATTNPFPTKNLMTAPSIITSGLDHTCAKNESLYVYCWGHNAQGQIGNGTRASGTNKSEFPTPNYMTNATLLVAGQYVTCAKNTTGMYCWGYAPYGVELGRGSPTNATPVLSFMTDPSIISYGGVIGDTGNGCAVNASGMYCWGYNPYGAAGTSNIGGTMSPTINNMANPIAIAAESKHACAANTSGIYCWGSNLDGQLGNGTSTGATYSSYLPQEAYFDILTLSRNAFGNTPDWINTILSNITANRSDGIPLVAPGNNLQMDRNWHLLTITKDASQIKTYKDGLLIYTVDNNSAATTTLSTIGRLDANSYYNGTIDQLTFYNRSLSAQQIQEMYSDGAGGYNRLVSQELAEGDNWTVAATPIDGDMDGSLYLSNPAYMLHKLSVNWTAAYNQSNAQLNATTWVAGGTNVTFNATINDPDNLIKNVWAVVWQTTVDAGNILWQELMSLVNGVYSVIFPTGTLSLGHNVNYTIYANDTNMLLTSVNGTFFYNYQPTIDGVNLSKYAIASNTQLDSTGLVGWWKLEKGNGTHWNDSSGNSNSMATNGTPSTAPLYTADGAAGGAHRFDGISDYITNQTVITASNELTISAWLKINKNEIKNVTAGGYSTCALMLNGDSYCWGRNNYGQLGDGTTTQRTIPTKTLMTAATQIGVGEANMCAVNASGMYCWGDNSELQLGGVTSGQKNQMTAPTQIAVGYFAECAMNASGMYCWGYNNYGQLGYGTTGDISTVTRNLMTSPTQISMKYNTACAVNSSGMYCWGFNANGQLGNGSSANTNEFPTKNYMANPTQITAGRHFTCATNTSGMYCWGNNDYGQLGNGSTSGTTNEFPTKNSMTNASQIALVDYYSTCATNSSGMYCWGDNPNGQLGDGSLSRKYTQIKNLMTAPTQITAGYYQACATNSSGIYCWGSSQYGQIGNGSTATINEFPTPTAWELLTLTRNAFTISPDWASTLLNNITASATAARTNLFGDTNWHLLTITKDSTQLKTYKDGSLIYTVDNSSAATTTLTAIGRLDANTYYNGSVDEVTVWNRTLSAGEVLSIYNRTKNIYTDHSLAASAVNTTDYNNDTVSYVYDWRNFGNSIAVLNMPFDLNGTGGSQGNWTTAKDYSSYANNAQYNGSISTMPRWNRTGGYDGKGAYQFDGTDDYINSGDVLQMNSATKLTISGWFKQTTLDQPGFMIGKGDTTSLATWVYTWSDGNLYTDIRNGSSLNSYGYFDYSPFVSAGNWFFYTMAYNGSGATNADKLKVYINGAEMTQNFQNNIYPSLGNASGKSLTIGTTLEPTNLGYKWNGAIDQVMIFNRSLSAQQIQEMYAQGTGHYNTLVAQELSENDTWSVVVTPNDGYEEGASYTSNTAEVLQKLVINWTAAYNASGTQVNTTTWVAGGTNVSFNATVQNPEGISISTVWVKIWKTVRAAGDVLWEGIMSLINGVYQTVAPTNTSFKHYTNYTIYANDTGMSIVLSDGTFFLNHKPSITAADLAATLSNNHTTENLTLSGITLSDSDGDAANYTADWRINSTSIALLNLPFELNGTGGSLGNWTTIRDYSSFANHGYYNGSAQAMPRWNRTAGYDGKGAYQFDGTDDYLTLNATTGTQNMTLNLWLKMNSPQIMNISSSGGQHSCALMQNGDVYCWGYNANGQIGDGTTTLRTMPTKAQMTAATQITAGVTHTCAVNTSGMYCWGLGSNGQIGDGTTTQRTSPTKNLMTNPTQIEANGYYTLSDTTCAINATGMYCWGINTNGQLGDGTTTQRNAPTLNFMTSPTQIAVGMLHTCAVNNSGMYCWGYNYQGQIGNGSSSGSNANEFPTLNYMTAPTQITAEHHTCAVNTSGMYCWGYNSHGQIGNGSSTDNPNVFPTKNMMTSPTQITAGYQHACAVNTSGMYCWGSNTYGQIGDGTTTQRTSPIKNLMTSPTQITVGSYSSNVGYHTCATNNTGMHCWGSNTYGELGNGSTSGSNANPSPTPVTWEILTLSKNAISTTPNWIQPLIDNATANRSNGIALPLANLYNDQNWHLLTITKDATQIKTYKDGTLIYTVDNNSATATTLSTIGRLDANSYYNGTMDQLTFYNRTLGADQIAAMYNAGAGNYDIIVKNETRKHESWQAVLTPYDPYEEGVAFYTANLSILDYPPSIPSLITTNNTNTTDTTPLLSWADAADNDTDTLTYILEVSQATDFSVINYTNKSVAETGNTTNDTTTLLADGAYYWRVRANDGEANGSFSSPYYVLTVDTTSPNITLSNVTNATGVLMNATLGTQRFQNLTFSVNATDDRGVQSVLLTIWQTIAATGVKLWEGLLTLANGLWQTTEVFLNLSYPKNAVINYTLNATDMLGNLQNYQGNFTVENTAPAQPTLLTPNNNSNVTVNSVTFVWANTTDNDTDAKTYILEASTAADFSTVYFTNVSVAETGNTTNATSSALPDGTIYWRVRANDGEANSTWSQYFNMTINTAPNLSGITQLPDNPMSIDPNTQINITVNITSNYPISRAILQWKESAEDTWNNKTMSNTSATIYASNFTTAITEAVYYYRIWANNSVGTGSAYSDTLNTTSVWEYSWNTTWTATGTKDLGSTAILVNIGTVIGTIQINNTGDAALTYDLTDNSPYGVTYNYSEPFSLAAKAIKNIKVNATGAPITREDTFGITASASHILYNPAPASNRLNATIVSYAGGPYLYAVMTDAPTTAAQSTGGHVFKAYVKNLGNETATNVTATWTLPTGWSRTDSENATLGNISDTGGIAYTNITASLTSSASVSATNSITLNATSSNNVSYRTSASVIVSCNLTDSVCGTGCTITTDPVDCGLTLASTTAASGGGGAGGGGAGVSLSASRNFLTSNQTFEITRGEAEDFIIIIQNPYVNSTLRNVSVSISGFLEQYVKITSSMPGEVPYNQSRNVTVRINAPSYMKYGNYTLTAKITGKVVKADRSVDMLEERKINLVLYELSPRIAANNLAAASEDLQKMIAAGLPTRNMQAQLEKAQQLIANKRYKEADDLAKAIIANTKLAFETDTQMKGLRAALDESKSKGLSAPETQRIYGLALAAFEREDFKAATERIKEAQFTIIVETKGKVNLAYFVINNWWQVLLTLALLSIAILIGYNRFQAYSIFRRLRRLDLEEVNISEMIKQAQKECFDYKKITVLEFHKLMYSYNKRLEEIRQKRINLRSRKIRIFRLENRFQDLNTERNYLIGLIRKLQKSYFEDKTTDYETYRTKLEALTLRNVEIQKEIALLKAKSAVAEAEKHKNPKTRQKNLTAKQKRHQQIIRLAKTKIQQQLRKQQAKQRRQRFLQIKHKIQKMLNQK